MTDSLTRDERYEFRLLSEHEAMGEVTAPPLWAHQEQAAEEAVAALRCVGGFLLAHEPRVGKSRTAIEVARRLGAQRVLVVCPDKVRAVWAEQVARFWPDAPPLVMVEGGVAKKRELARKDGPRVTVVGYQSGWRLPELEAAGWDLLIADEAHMAKSWTGKASRWIRKVAARVPHRLALTGTPLPHSPLDALGVVGCIFPDHPLGFDTLTRFRGRFLRPAGYEEWRDRNVVVTKGYGGALLRWKYRDLDELQRRIYWRDGVKVGSRVLARDAVSMPEELDEVVAVELEPEARRLYQRLKSELVAELGSGGVVSASNALVALLRLSQVTGGTVVSDDGVHTVVSRAKEEALTAYLEEAGDEPVVVFCRFHGDMDAAHRAAEAAGVESRELSGRRNELAEWQGGGGQVLVTQIQAGGVGVSLVRSRLVVWFSTGWSLGDHTQARSRVLGPEQDRPVVFTTLVAVDTVDNDVARALVARTDVVGVVVEALAAGAR